MAKEHNFNVINAFSDFLVEALRITGKGKDIKRRMKMKVVLSLICALALMFAGCSEPNGGGGQGNSIFSITFNSHGGTNHSPEAGNAGARIVLPTPSRENHIFNGWFSSASGGVFYGMGGEYFTITASLTMHAQWELNENGYENLRVTKEVIRDLFDATVYEIAEKFGMAELELFRNDVGLELETEHLNNSAMIHTIVVNWREYNSKNVERVIVDGLTESGTDEEDFYFPATREEFIYYYRNSIMSLIVANVYGVVGNFIVSPMATDDFFNVYTLQTAIFFCIRNGSNVEECLASLENMESAVIVETIEDLSDIAYGVKSQRITKRQRIEVQIDELDISPNMEILFLQISQDESYTHRIRIFALENNNTLLDINVRR